MGIFKPKLATTGDSTKDFVKVKAGDADPSRTSTAVADENVRKELRKYVVCRD